MQIVLRAQSERNCSLAVALRNYLSPTIRMTKRERNRRKVMKRMTEAEKEKIDYLIQFLYALKQASEAGVTVHREVRKAIEMIDEILDKKN